MEKDSFDSVSFTREERIKRADEIAGLFKKGKKYGCSGAKLFVLPNSKEYNRIVFALQRGYGGAVQRNRSRRLSREVYRHMKNRLKRGFDLLLLVYPGNDTFQRRRQQFGCLCAKASLFISRTPGDICRREEFSDCSGSSVSVLPPETRPLHVWR